MLVLNRITVAFSALSLAAFASAQIMSVDPLAVSVTATGGTYFTTENRNAQNQWKSRTLQNASFTPLPTVTEAGTGLPSGHWKTARAWTMSYSEDTRQLVYTVYGSADWTGAATFTYTMTMAAPTGGQRLVGLQLHQERNSSNAYGTTTVATTGTEIRLNSAIAWTAVPELSQSATYTTVSPGPYNGPIVYFPSWKSSFHLRGVSQLNHNAAGPSNDNLRNDIRAIYGTQAPVPEPASVAVLSIGLVALRRRRRG